jgi:hypothetical protein
MEFIAGFFSGIVFMQFLLVLYCHLYLLNSVKTFVNDNKNDLFMKGISSVIQLTKKDI